MFVTIIYINSKSSVYFHSMQSVHYFLFISVFDLLEAFGSILEVNKSIPLVSCWTEVPRTLKRKKDIYQCPYNAMLSNTLIPWLYISNGVLNVKTGAF